MIAGSEATVPQTYLIVSLRYIGDVLLSTPLARSIKAAVPGAAVDFLVFEGTEGILAGNVDVRSVMTVRPGSRDVRSLASGWRSYDVAIGANASDRTAFQLLAKGKRTVGFVDPRPKEWWKRAAFSHCSVYDPDRHVVETLLAQLRFLGIPPVPIVQVPYSAADLDAARGAAGTGEFVLFHPYTRWAYKKWPGRSWADLCRRVEERTGRRVLFTRAPGPREQAMAAELGREGIGEDRIIDRPLSIPQVNALISLCRAYVGVDTVVTHMAAASGKPTVAIFGPTPAWRWGPWPKGHALPSPYHRRGGEQRCGNVTIVQKAWECAACDRMGCDHRPDSESRCLTELLAEEVFRALERVVSPG